MAGVVVGEEPPDVRGPDRAEEGVGDGVQDGVSVGMPDGTRGVVEEDAGEDERAARPVRGPSAEEPRQAPARREPGSTWLDSCMQSISLTPGGRGR